MSDNIEITVNNPLNILDQNEENKENEELTNSESSGELSYDSDDESSESYLIFLEEGNSESTCYVCHDKTIYISPCQCKISICNDCFIDVIINNGKNCTICRDRFEESIIADVKNNFSEVSHSSVEVTEFTTSLTLRNRDGSFKSFICFVMIILIVFTAPIFGMIGKLIFYNYFYGDIYTFENYIIGLIFWLNLLLYTYILRGICKFLKYLYEEFILIMYYYFIRQ